MLSRPSHRLRALVWPACPSSVMSKFTATLSPDTTLVGVGGTDRPAPPLGFCCLRAREWKRAFVFVSSPCPWGSHLCQGSACLALPGCQHGPCREAGLAHPVAGPSEGPLPILAWPFVPLPSKGFGATVSLSLMLSAAGWLVL